MAPRSSARPATTVDRPEPPGWATEPARALRGRFRESRRARSRAAERLDLHLAELDPPALGLEADVAARDLAGLEDAGHRAVDPKGDLLALAGDLVGVPLAGRLDPLVAELPGEVDPLDLAVDEGVAEQVAAGSVAGLGLVPDRGVGRVADVDPGVIPLLARDEDEPPLDVEDEVAELLVPAEPFVPAVAGADDVAPTHVDRPLRGVRLRGGRLRHRAGGDVEGPPAL